MIAISGKIWGDLWKEILEEKGPEIYSGSVITIKTLSPGRKSGGKRWLNIWMF